MENVESKVIAIAICDALKLPKDKDIVIYQTKENYGIKLDGALVAVLHPEIFETIVYTYLAKIKNYN